MSIERSVKRPAVSGYIAASRYARDRAKSRAVWLQRLGFGIVSSWHDEIEVGQPDPTDPEIARKILDRNYAAIMHADFLLALTDPRCGETYCEIRYALELKSISAVVWSRENGGLILSANDPRVTLVDTDLDAINYLRELYRDAPGIR